jgi:hypothetical protein
MYGTSGTSPQIRKAENVTQAAFQGDRGEVVFLDQHGPRPAVLVGRDGLHGPVQGLAREALDGEDLPDLLALAVRFGGDVPPLHGEHPCGIVLLGLGAGIVGRRHGEPVGDQVGEAQDQDHPDRQLGARHAGDHGEGRDRPVDAAIDPVAQILRVRPPDDAGADRGRVVGVFQRHGKECSGERRSATRRP